jgi:2,4-dichlorophenol 6-monooxygenase
MTGISYWTVNNVYATHMQNGRVFVMGDAAHRHPPSNGLGSNTSIQDAFNLAWKLAMVLKGKAGPGLLDSFSQERAPVARQIVTRANKSIPEFGPIFEALGMDASLDHDTIGKRMDARVDPTAEGERRRAALRAAIAYKKYEFDCHGVEMNQRYRSSAVIPDGTPEPAWERDEELHYQPTTWPGARLPHVWVWDRNGTRLSSLDLVGHGRFTLLTGIGGEEWTRAAAQVGEALGIEIAVIEIGPRKPFLDHAGDWARIAGIRDAGCLLVRPDQHVAWRSDGPSDDPQAALTRVLSAILNR